jgi:hypothetical protein
MIALLFLGAALLSEPQAATPPAPPNGADPAAQCARLSQEAAGLRRQRNAGAGRRLGGFLAGAANRALAYAPPVELGDSVLGRVAAREIEGEAHERASSGLSSVESDARAAAPAAPGDRLREIESETRRLSCPANG